MSLTEDGLVELLADEILSPLLFLCAPNLACWGEAHDGAVGVEIPSKPPRLLRLYLFACSELDRGSALSSMLEVLLWPGRGLGALLLYRWATPAMPEPEGAADLDSWGSDGLVGPETLRERR